MTVKDTIESDQSVFLNIDESPGAATAVWTPKGGVAQPSFTVLFVNFPLHGDANQELNVEQPITTVVGKSSDVSGIKAEDTILINSTTHRIVNAPYPTENDNFWSVLDLSLPRGEETGI